GFPASWAERAVTEPDQVAGLEQALGGADRAVVIVGSSISGLVLAARLGTIAKRHKGLRVVLVAGAPPVRRRLVAGCSLRRSTIRRMARAMSVDESVFFERVGGRTAAFRRLAVARAEPGSAPPRLVARRTDAAVDPYVGLSTRHGAILAALRASLDPALDVIVVDGDVPRQGPLDGGRLPLLLKGKDEQLVLPAGRAVVLNATSRADLLRPGARTPAPKRYVVAVQAPLRLTGATPWCGDDVGLAPMTFGPPAPHLAFFTPFGDPDTPEATWYGINTMTLSAAELDAAGPAAVTTTVWDRLVELEGQLGFAELDPGATRGEAVVPVVRDTAVAGEASLDNGAPVVDVHRSFSSGAPAINVDGMLAAVVGADAFAGAFGASDASSPVAAARAALAAADKALRSVRWRNLATEWLFFQAPEAVRAGAARNTRLGWKAFVLDWARLGGRGGQVP
ncbi:MAG TPA: hypothetical protein VEN99_10945, partial [Acidimicrobiia bacterium]|nr:hypothetical protein [Acidimicrobiia bacterium]